MRELPGSPSSRRRLPATSATALLAAAVLALGAAGCGSSGSSPTTAARSTSRAPAEPSTPAPGGGSASVTTGPVRGTLSAESHTPTVGKLWSYSVRVTDAAGHPLSGIVDIEFVFGGSVVGRDTPPTHPLTDGLWHDRDTFPADAAGYPLTFQAVVHTSAGSITLDWPITVRP